MFELTYCEFDREEVEDIFGFVCVRVCIEWHLKESIRQLNSGRFNHFHIHKSRSVVEKIKQTQIKAEEKQPRCWSWRSSTISHNFKCTSTIVNWQSNEKKKKNNRRRQSKSMEFLSFTRSQLANCHVNWIACECAINQKKTQDETGHKTDTRNPSISHAQAHKTHCLWAQFSIDHWFFFRFRYYANVQFTYK